MIESWLPALVVEAVLRTDPVPQVLLLWVAMRSAQLAVLGRHGRNPGAMNTTTSATASLLINDMSTSSRCRGVTITPGRDHWQQHR